MLSFDKAGVLTNADTSACPNERIRVADLLTIVHFGRHWWSIKSCEKRNLISHKFLKTLELNPRRVIHRLHQELVSTPKLAHGDHCRC